MAPLEYMRGWEVSKQLVQSSAAAAGVTRPHQAAVGWQQATRCRPATQGAAAQPWGWRQRLAAHWLAGRLAAEQLVALRRTCWWQVWTWGPEDPGWLAAVVAQRTCLPWAAALWLVAQETRSEAGLTAAAPSLQAASAEAQLVVWTAGLRLLMKVTVGVLHPPYAEAASSSSFLVEGRQPKDEQPLQSLAATQAPHPQQLAVAVRQLKPGMGPAAQVRPAAETEWQPAVAGRQSQAAAPLQQPEGAADWCHLTALSLPQCWKAVEGDPTRLGVALPEAAEHLLHSAMASGSLAVKTHSAVAAAPQIPGLAAEFLLVLAALRTRAFRWEAAGQVAAWAAPPSSVASPGEVEGQQ